MSYPDTIGYLYSLQKFGIKLGLEKTEKILSCIGNPHKDFLCIHVAGTNGKGSVSAMTASILMQHGFRVGLYTSPHLVSFTERIRINNKQISESDVVRLTNEIKFEIRNSKFEIPEPTFFEFVTAMAFLHFSRSNVDWAVIETGMGGRLDATNLIIPEVSVITRVSYDHKEFLGETLSAIAGEKAGIIKNRVPVVSIEQEKEAEEVLLKTARKKISSLFIYNRDFKGILKSSDLHGITFDYYDSTFNTQQPTFKNLFVPLAGEHQLSNACLAVKATMIALKRAEVKDFQASGLPLFCSSALKDGLASTKWHGRLEIVNREPLIIVDGAHNPDASSVLAEFIKKHLYNYKIILIMGIMSDKDMKGIMSPLMPLASDIIFTAPNYGRAASPQKLAEIALHMGFHSKTSNSIKDAIEMAKDRAEERKNKRAEGKTSELILITGSLYTIGEAMEVLGEKSVLGTLRETA